MGDRYPDGVMMAYTWGIKGKSDELYLFNLSRAEAEQIAFHNPQFHAVPVSKHKCPPRGTNREPRGVVS